MTSATEVLRRMLDERGVVWGAPAGYDGSTKYDTIVDGYWFHEYDGRITVHGLTLEQAIAATLGPVTCYDEGDPSDFCCSECGVRMFTDTSDTYTMIASDGRTIIKHPNYCPNCGRRCVG